MIILSTKEQYDSYFEDNDNLYVRGISTIQIKIRLLYVLRNDNKQSRKQFNKFKSFLVCELKRGITNVEHNNLVAAIKNYKTTASMSKERIEAVKYLVNLKFLEI